MKPSITTVEAKGRAALPNTVAACHAPPSASTQKTQKAALRGW
ncbi:hypothetical protein [Frigoribacterium sp. PhB107]|nr:hypothetical protein [Frigoribacterium sp. PhB107]